jgi:hypothetical protein
MVPILELASQRGEERETWPGRGAARVQVTRGRATLLRPRGREVGPWGDGCHGQQGEELGGGRRRTQQRGSRRPDPQPWGARPARRPRPAPRQRLRQGPGWLESGDGSRGGRGGAAALVAGAATGAGVDGAAAGADGLAWEQSTSCPG